MRYLVAFLLALAGPLSAQDTAAVAGLTGRQKADIDTLSRLRGVGAARTIAARATARADSVYRTALTGITVRTDTLRVLRVDTVKVTNTVIRIDTVRILRVDTVRVATTTPTPVPTPVPPPTQPPVDTSPPPVVSTGATIGPAAVAELPRATVSTSYPSGLSQTRLQAGADLQGAINACAGEILLPPGSTWIGNFTLPNRSVTTWCVIRTDLPDSVLGPRGTRMTPSKAAAVRLAKILTANTTNASLAQTQPYAHHYRFTGVELGATSAVLQLNALVRFGDDAWTQTTANTPKYLILDRVYLHGTPTLSLARCLALNSALSAAVDSWFADCHGKGGDSQGIAGWNGPGPFLIQNNHLEGGHEVIVFGGGSFTVANGSPSDITIRGNHITRPASWQRPMGTDGQRYDTPTTWPAKNLIETKHAKRLLIEGNVVENTWRDAQDFAFVLKSENQNNDNPWTQTADVTIRYNRIRNVGSVFNLSGQYSPDDPRPTILSARYTVYDNVAENVNVSPFTADGTCFQFLNGLQDGAVFHNTCFNAASQKFLSMDGPAKSRLAFHSNAMFNGQYGISTSVGSGATGWSASAPGGLWASNLVVGCSAASVPTSTSCPSAMPTTLPLGYDGRPIGADLSKVNAATLNAVVQP